MLKSIQMCIRDSVEAVLRRVHAGAEVFDLGDCHVEFGTHRVLALIHI